MVKTRDFFNVDLIAQIIETLIFIFHLIFKHLSGKKENYVTLDESSVNL